MNKNKFISGVMFLMIITLVSCKRDVQQIDISNGANNADFVIIDTLSIITHSVREDSLPTSKLSANHIGALKNSEFGNINASVAFSFSLPNITSFSFPTNTNVDSVVLVMEYEASDAYNGNLNTVQQLEVYEISKRIYQDTLYYSNANVEYNIGSIGSFSAKYNLQDSFFHTLNNFTEKQSPQLRINLDKNTFGNKLVNSGSNLSSNETFQNYINGLYIKCETVLGQNDGVIARVAPLAKNSGIRVYYNDSLSVLFPVGTTGVKFNKYQNEFGGSSVSNQFAGGNFDETYLNSLASTKVSIEIPNLYKILENNDYTLVGAIFEFYIDPTSIQPGFEPPSNINLFKKSKEGYGIGTYEQFNETDLYDGSFNKTEQKYSFGLTRSIQDLLYQYKKHNQDLNYGFYLVMPSGNPITSSRLKMDTRKNIPDGGVKLKLSLVKIK